MYKKKKLGTKTSKLHYLSYLKHFFAYNQGYFRPCDDSYCCILIKTDSDYDTTTATK